MILGGDFNPFFNKKLECKGGRSVLKKQLVSHIIKLQDAFDLCDIWPIRNPTKNVSLSDKSIFPELSNADSTERFFSVSKE